MSWCFTFRGAMSSSIDHLVVALDRALHDDAVGRQCDGVLRFGDLLLSQPFPALVNATLLKLTDLFVVTYVINKKLLILCLTLWSNR